MLDSTTSSPTNNLALVRARALCAAGRLAWFELDLLKARTLIEESVALFRSAGDSLGLLNALSSLMMVLSWQGEDELAQARLQEGMHIVRGIEDRIKLLPVLSNFGWAAIFTSSPHALEDGWNLNKEVEALAREANDKRGLAWALDGLGLCCYFRQEYEPSLAFLQESAALFGELGELWAVAQIGFGLGNIAIEQERYDEALIAIDESLSLLIQSKSWVGLPYTLEMYAYLAIAQKQPERAAHLLGATEKLRERTFSARQPLILALFERNMTALRALLPAEELDAAWTQGRALTSESAIAFARSRKSTEEK
ncbi:hypothetical protein IAD21_05274 [Abditibacteriota bacterium]|nr:hypothetical protein IAD21_05274 [Abditibacteriota bacterium]